MKILFLLCFTLSGLSYGEVADIPSLDELSTQKTVVPAATVIKPVAAAAVNKSTVTAIKPLAAAAVSKSTVTVIKPVAAVAVNKSTVTATKPVAAVAVNKSTVTATKPVAVAAVNKSTVTATKPVAAVTVNKSDNGDFLAAKKHRVVQGDTLWDLSAFYYGSPYKWGTIYNANTEKVLNPDLIYPKSELEIPGITEKVSPINKVASVTAVAPVSMEQRPETVVALPAAVEKAEAGKLLSQVAPAAVEESKGIVTEKEPITKANDKVLDYQPTDFSSNMPIDHKIWAAGITEIMPKGWKEDGVILGKAEKDVFDYAEAMASPGDKVEIEIRNHAKLAPQDIVRSYILGAIAYNRKTKKKLGRELQRTGEMKILKITGKTAEAIVLEVNNAIIRGQFIKKKK